MAKKRKRRSPAAVYDYDAAFEYGLIADRLTGEIGRRADRLQDHLEQLAREQDELEAQQLANSYRDRRLAEETAAKRIAPQFVSYVRGSSPEEVEESIRTAVRKTAEIATEIRQAQRQHAPNPDERFIAEVPQQRQVGTDMSFSDYVKRRDQLIKSNTSGGIFQ